MWMPYSFKDHHSIMSKLLQSSILVRFCFGMFWGFTSLFVTIHVFQWYSDLEAGDSTVSEIQVSRPRFKTPDPLIRKPRAKPLDHWASLPKRKKISEYTDIKHFVTDGLKGMRMRKFLGGADTSGSETFAWPKHFSVVFKQTYCKLWNVLKCSLSREDTILYVLEKTVLPQPKSCNKTHCCFCAVAQNI